jgi:hypothetical protein
VTAVQTSETYFDGVRYWRDASGQTLASRDGTGFVTDHRQRPPFAQILPCPYCGVTDDRGHEPRLHVDRRLGIVTAGGDS